MRVLHKNLFLHSAVFVFLYAFSIIQAQQLSAEKTTEYSMTADKIIRTALAEMKGYDWLKELCKIGPRLSGSENSMKAISWAKDKMVRSGFDKVWLQPVSVPKWERGKIENAVITEPAEYGNHELTISSLGGSIGTPPEGINAGVVEILEFDEMKNADIKGKIVFLNRPFDNGLVNTFAAYGKAVNQRTAGAIEAARHGAVAVLVRSVTSRYDDVPHVGVMYYNDTIPKIPSAAISLVDADFLSNVLRKDKNLKINIKMDCANFPEVQSYNVIGEITGAEIPDEVIVLGGHFDSWDKGCGAHDDGAPCLQTMEVPDLFKRLNIRPKRTIRCVLFINEENGSRGGIAYGQYADTAKETHLAAIESDRGAFTPRGFSVTADSTKISKMQSWLPVLNKALIEWIKPGGSGVDVSYIKSAKMLGGYVPDDQRYMDVHHSDNDTLETVSPREMEMGSAAMAIFAYFISEEGI